MHVTASARYFHFSSVSILSVNRGSCFCSHTLTNSWIRSSVAVISRAQSCSVPPGWALPRDGRALKSHYLCPVTVTTGIANTHIRGSPHTFCHRNTTLFFDHLLSTKLSCVTFVNIVAVKYIVTLHRLKAHFTYFYSWSGSGGASQSRKHKQVWHINT